MDSDLDPNTFLQSVRELKEKRQKEDDERFEQLEAQIIQDRNDRLARKLERERSLSPEKTPQSSTSRLAGRDFPPSSNASPSASTAHVASPQRTPSNTFRPLSANGPSEGRASPLRMDTQSANSPSKMASSRTSSPSKTSPSTPGGSSKTASFSGASSPSKAAFEDASSPHRASPGASTLARSGTLSWQNRRPGSISVRSRPLSVAAGSERGISQSPTHAQIQEIEPPTKNGASATEEVLPSKDKIAQSLETKDPAWFRQTADRGLNSPAYRSSGDANGDGHDSPSRHTDPSKRELPGLSRARERESSESTARVMSPPPESTQSSAASRTASVRNSAAWSSRPSSMTSGSFSEQRRSTVLPPIDALKSVSFGPEQQTSTSDAEPAPSNRPSSSAQNRPASPTKGMGGFVQSAMLKRSDSVSKRWSATPSASVSRQDSTASVRNGLGSVRYSQSSMAASRSMPKLDTAMAGSDSRPSSSHSTISNFALGATEGGAKDESARPASSHSRSRSVASLIGPNPDGITSPPLSPSKRFSRSPTKSSWLESALARPESPKPVVQPSQPSWMAEITKAKQQRSSGEASLSQDTLNAAPGQSTPRIADAPMPRAEEPAGQISKRSSVRSSIESPARNVTPPTKAKPLSLSGKPASPKAHASESTKSDEPPSPESTKLDEFPKVPTPKKPAALRSPSSEKTGSTEVAPVPKPLSFDKPKPKVDAPAKNDFRAGLKSRADAGNAPAKDEPEFKAIFGKLKKAQPEKYVAPDELKGNIVRGKAGLAASAGPQKSERKDEFRQSLVLKKDEIKLSASTGKTVDAKISPAPAPSLPEALMKKRQLGRSNSTLNIAQPDKQRRDVTPEALTLHKTLRGKDRAPSPEKRASVIKAVETKPQPEPAPEKRVDAPTPLAGAKVTASDSTRKLPSPVEDLKPATASSPQRLPSPPVDTLKGPSVRKMPSPLEDSKPTTVASPQRLPSPAVDTLKGSAVSSKLAERFNPALAGILARGPPSQGSNPGTPRSESPLARTLPTQNSQDDSAVGGQLTHMTKDRARGPKRRKPKASKAPVSGNTPPAPVSSVQIDASKSESVAPSGAETAALKSFEPVPQSTTMKDMSSSMAAKAAEEQNRPSPVMSRKALFEQKPESSPPAAAPSKISSDAAFSKRFQQDKSDSASPSSSDAPKISMQTAAKPTIVQDITSSLTAKAQDQPKISRPEAGRKPVGVQKDVSPTPSKTVLDQPRTSPPAVVEEAKGGQKASPTAAKGAESERQASPTAMKKLREEQKAPSPVSTPQKPSSYRSSTDRPSRDLPSRTATPTKPSPTDSTPRKPSSSVRPASTEVAKPATPPKPIIIAPVPTAQERKSFPGEEPDADKENRSGAVKNTAAFWGSKAQDSTSQKRNEPVKLARQHDQEAAMRSTNLTASSPPKSSGASATGLGISTGSKQQFSDGNRSTYLSGTTGLPPKPPVKSSRVVSASLTAKDLPKLPDAPSTKAGQDLVAFFGEVPFSTNELQIDTESVLSKRPNEAGQVKTLRKSIQEISGEGKLAPLPAQEEHILYERSMYVCTHVFGTSDGARTTEVYLWAGVGVSESSIQDAQLFAKKIAREASTGQRSTPLLIIHQNREPSTFFQALGGIVIIRRGTRAENSVRPYMLCGRPHLGHVAFDEVELSKASLASDFPYVVAKPVTIQDSKVYLWKGNTCGAEAIGVARLIAMDLNPSGDVIEIEEGKEPQDLLEVLGDLSVGVCSSPELWSKTRDRWNHSAARLFRIEASAPKQGATSLFSTLMGRRPSWNPARSPSPTRPFSLPAAGIARPDVSVREIAPFTQLDLEPEGCFVLDCGPTILLLPGPLISQQQHYQETFMQALLFAHDYCILCASLEDRPAIPKAAVSLSGLPRDAQLRFRRWDQLRGTWGIGGMMAGRRQDQCSADDLLDVRETLDVCRGR